VFHHFHLQSAQRVRNAAHFVPRGNKISGDRGRYQPDILRELQGARIALVPGTVHFEGKRLNHYH